MRSPAPPSALRLRGLPRTAGIALGLALAASPATAGDPPPATPGLEALEERIIAVSEKVKPSVVHIEAIVKIDDRRNQVTGSGVIADADGTILTNHHVVERAEKVTVTVSGRRARYPARILGTDKQTDLAVLRIEPDPAHPLQPATFGRTADVRVGQWVLAVGNPYGLDGTVSFGIVSAKGRNLELSDVLNDFIQTDAMIDVGSSGGPLVDLAGRVLGINSRGQGRGIGFTIPIDTALDVRKQIEEGGIERGWIGITMQPLDRDLAAYFGVPDATGVIVNSVSTRSPAARAGLEPGDVVTHWGDTALDAEKEEDLGAFQRIVARVRPGEKVPVRVLRGGRPKTLEIEVATQPSVEPAVAESDVGFHVQEITESVYREQRLSTRRGAFVSFVARGSPAAEAGLSPGDVVERVEKAEVGDVREFQRAMGAIASRPSFLLTARRGAETKFLLVKRAAGPETAGEGKPGPGTTAHEPAGPGRAAP